MGGGRPCSRRTLKVPLSISLRRMGRTSTRRATSRPKTLANSGWEAQHPPGHRRPLHGQRGAACLQARVERAGIRTGDVTLHTLRHTAISRMVARVRRLHGDGGERAQLDADAGAVHAPDRGAQSRRVWLVRAFARRHNRVTFVGGTRGELERIEGFAEENWWTAGGSNSRPPRCERGALPTELAAPDRTKIIAYRLGQQGAQVDGASGYAPLPSEPRIGSFNFRTRMRTTMRDGKVGRRALPGSPVSRWRRRR